MLSEVGAFMLAQRVQQPEALQGELGLSIG